MSTRDDTTAFTLGEIVGRLGGELVGDGTTVVRRIAPLESATAGDISFLANPRYRAKVTESGAAAFILPPAERELTDVPRILADDPYLYFARLAQLLNPARQARGGVAASATLESAVPASAEIGPGCWIGPEVTIGERVILGAGCHVAAGASIGDDCLLYPGVSVYEDCRIGARCILHSGAVIGADGFGFARAGDGSWIKIPQTGRVLIGDDVEIGANTTIDRGALDDTVIEDGAKLDNQIMIAHNVRIGRHTVIAGNTGIAGSTQIGARCMLGGMVGVVGHLTVADDVVVSGGSVISKSLNRKGVYTGQVPIQAHADWIRNFSHIRHLDAMADKIRALEKRLSELEKGSSA